MALLLQTHTHRLTSIQTAIQHQNKYTRTYKNRYTYTALLPHALFIDKAHICAQMDKEHTVRTQTTNLELHAQRVHGVRGADNALRHLSQSEEIF
jgi:hypothetical protein